MSFEFDERELEMLRRVVAEYIADLRDEAHHTDARDYKEQLRSEETVLQGIQQKLGAQSS
ncbi:MAG: hypothetical protein WBP93_00380 [Pyrinomonadaceae bacterium]